MDAAFEEKRFAVGSWMWGLLAAFALVLGFAVPSHAFADDPTPQQETVVAVDDAAVVFDNAQASAPELIGAVADAPDDVSAASPLQEAMGEAAGIVDAPDDLVGHAESVVGNTSDNFAGKQVEQLASVASGLPKGQGPVENADDASPSEKRQVDEPSETAASSTRATAQQDASATLKPVPNERATEPQTSSREKEAQASESPASAAKACDVTFEPPAPASAPAWGNSASVYEEAARCAQEIATEKPAEQPVETIALPTAVWYPGSSNTAPGGPCAYIGAAQTRVDAPAPSSQYAVSTDQGSWGIAGSTSFADNERNLYALLLHRNARCRSP
ncbi:MAG: hypothetical protein IJ087_11850 [Eggerthellaceae bacterium]|nr:hypothetical protein [Eggerthellaceae bacterium]